MWRLVRCINVSTINHYIHPNLRNTIMSLHIQMSGDVENQLRKASLRNKISSLLACILFLGGGGLILALTVIFIGESAPSMFMIYVPPSESLANEPKPDTQHLSSRAASPSPAVSPVVIVSTAVAPVSMAMVDVPMEDSLDVGTTMDLRIGLDDGFGDSLGDGGDALGSGKPGGSALEGFFTT